MRRLMLAGLLLTAGCLAESGPNTVAYLEVTDDSGGRGVFVGDHVQLTPTTLDINGNPVSAVVKFVSSNPAVATVSGSGLISALTLGTTTVAISSGGAKANLIVTVDGNVPSTVSLAPPNPSVTVGSQQALVATILTTAGNAARGKSLIWTTADASKVTVDQSGLVTAVLQTSGVSICAAVADAPAVKGCTVVTVP